VAKLGASFSGASGVELNRPAWWGGTTSMHGWNSHVIAAANDGVNTEGVLGRRTGVASPTKAGMEVG